MNYRHAYHAGNFADVVKHALLVRILTYLRLKDKPFRVIDTHAGIGLYDLAGEEAGKTGEWVDGIGRLDEPLPPEAEALIAPYKALVSDVKRRHGDTIYPGSPAIIRELLRRQDQAVFVELHPDDCQVLTERFNETVNTKVLHLDAWTALKSLIPPKEKRGLVLIDPPYEVPEELPRMIEALVQAVHKWPTGLFAAWYPIKGTGPVDAAARILNKTCPRPGLRLELLIDKTDDPSRLNGCGLFIINPPWVLRQEADVLLQALSGRLSRHRYGAYRCDPFGPSA